MKLSEFASRYGISERHARRIFEKSMSELAGHYERKGNAGTSLDDYAVSYLRDLLRQNVALSPETEQSDRERDLEGQLKVALARYASLAEKLADAERRAGQNAAAAALLEASKESLAKIEAGAKEAEERARVAEMKAMESEKQAVAAAQRKMEAELALEESRERAETADQIAEAAGQEAEAAKRRADELQAQLDRLASAGWLERRRILKNLKKGEQT